MPFHPLVNSWFAVTYGKATGVQEEAWPLIAAGEHVLALAPTGSGKTLTAFLAALSRFIDGSYRTDELSVLYVSPLKALNEDIKRNLLEPIASLGAYFAGRGAAFPEIRVETRSGDTPQSERRRFLRNPPAILALTPESLAILLLNPPGRRALSTVRYVILDEIHAALGTKRGAFLSCQIDRLALIAGEFQRVSLSATVRPAQAAADFTGGLGATPEGYEKRRVRIVAPQAEKRIELTVDFPRDTGQGKEGKPAYPYGPRYHILADIILERIRASRSAGGAGAILVFTGSRRRAERIAYLVNERAGTAVALVHHGSLSKEVRRSVEARLAAGQAACVVATGSLELGIDIGGVEEVILAGCPGSSTAALQRIGRSGHGVGLVSRGRLVPFTGVELLEAAALAAAVRDREIEETQPIANPLDILAQIILALCVERPRNIDGLYQTLRGFFVFQSLSRASYDQTVRMLAGRYAGFPDSKDGGNVAAGETGNVAGNTVRLRELKPRLYLDALSGELTATPGALLLLYASGGVIANRGSYSLRLAGGVKIGELDEEFVWERRLGDNFEFGARTWSITAIGPEAVEVVPQERKSDFVPFWKADAAFRSPVIARRVLELLEEMNGPDEPGRETRGTLAEQGISAPVFEELTSFIRSQRQAQKGTPLPGRAVLPVEILDDPVNRGDVCSVLLHGFRGGAVQYPLAMALAEELEESLGLRVETIPDDTAILLLLPRLAGDDPETLIRRALGRLGEGDWGERRFRARLESSGIFGAAFREAAERSLLLPRAGFGKRSPLWLTRQRAKRLFDAVAPLGDFPAIAEAWRTCLIDQFDIPGFRELLRELACGGIVLSFFRTSHPSPFARDIVWKETNAFMYEYDERPERRGTSIGDHVIAEAVGFAVGGTIGEADPAGRNRPSLPAGLTADFCARLRRELPGWIPEDEPVLAEWVKERIAVPLDEWETLLAAASPELRDRCRADPSLKGRIAWVLRKGARVPSLVHREYVRLWEEGGAAQLGPWLRYEGPVTVSRIQEVFGLSLEEAEDAVTGLFGAGELVRRVRIVDAGADLICDRENYELLLRLTRKKTRPVVRERPAPALTPYLALRQGLWGVRQDLSAGTAGAFSGGNFPWEKLTGFSAPAALWETEFFPARLPDYRPELLDGELHAGRLLWYGTGKERAAFCLPEDFDPAVPVPEAGFLSAAGDPGFFDRPRDFWEIKEAWKLDTVPCAGRLWRLVWQGLLSADSWDPLRRGIERGFVPQDVGAALGEHAAGLPVFAGIPGARRRPLPRALRDRWRAGPPVPGRWFSLLSDDAGDRDPRDHDPGDHDPWDLDPLDEEELNRDRVRLLLARWGVLCRPLLEREAGPFSWSRLLPAIRRLELAGELTAGRFFAGINSLQFAAPSIPAELEEADACRGVYWMNAADPASPAGLDMTGLDPRFPARLAATRLCFRGPELAAAAGRNGRTLTVFVSPDDPDLPAVLGFLTVPRTRRVQPLRKLLIETINEKNASESPFAGALKALGFLPDRGKLILW